ncbi:MAG TPA: DUF883 C-terminal domain-containing protein [Pyrinomonadaceae bacterium]|jgi:ElaB/YqjD/DUF883 family membrane-anchored ribosome-binding protein|nr:DUF883 C-terminal domain-containing protein [Pyrinomonadaceae bacterium]
MAEEFDVLSDNRALTRSTPPNGADEAQSGNYGQDLKTQAQQYSQQAVDAINKAKDYAGEYLGQAGEKIKDLQNKDFGQITEEAKDFARRKPVQAIGIAAAVGLVVGMLLRGGRR